MNDSFSLSGTTSGEINQLNISDSGDSKKKKRKKKNGSKRAVSPPPSGSAINFELDNVTTTSEIV